MCLWDDSPQVADIFKNYRGITFEDFISNVLQRSRLWLETAAQLSRTPPRSRDLEFQAHVIVELDGITSSIDILSQAFEMVNFFISAMWTLLHCQALALFWRFDLLGCSSYDTLHHAIRTAELMLQFVSSPREHYLTSLIFEGIRYRSIIPYPSPFWDLSRILLSSLHLTLDFLYSVAQIPSKKSQAEEEEELKRAIATLGKITEEKTIDVDEFGTVAAVLFLGGLVHIVRFLSQPEEIIPDLDRVISDLEIAYTISVAVPYWFRMVVDLLLMCLMFRNSRFGDSLQDLDRVIDIGEDIMRSPGSWRESKSILVVFLLVLGLAFRAAATHLGVQIGQGIPDCERVIELFEENTDLFPLSHEFGYDQITGAVVFAWYYLTVTKGQRFDVDKVSEHSEQLLYRDVNHEILPMGPMVYCTLLWGQLKIVAVALDKETACEIFECIQTLGIEETYESLGSVFRFHGDVDNTISLLQQHCPLPDPTASCGSFRPLVFVLTAALLWRHKQTGSAKDYQDGCIYHLWLQKDQFRQGNPFEPMIVSEYAANVGGRVVRARFTDILTGTPEDCPIRDKGQGKHISSSILKPKSSTPFGTKQYRSAVDRLEIEEDKLRGHEFGGRFLDELIFSASPSPTALGGLLSQETISDWIPPMNIDRKGLLDIAEQTLKESCESVQAFGWDRSHRTLLAFVLVLIACLPTENRKYEDLVESISVPYILASLDNLRHEQSPGIWKIRSLRLWMLIARFFLGIPAIHEHCLPHLEEVMNTMLCALEEKSWVASGVWESIVDRQRYSDEMRSSLAVVVAKTDRVPLMVEFSERWNGLIWSQLGQLRAPLDALTAVNPELASRLESVSKSLEERWVKFDASSCHLSLLNPIELSNYRHYEERQRILEEIRLVPGFQDFLKHRSYLELQKEISGIGGIVVLILCDKFSRFAPPVIIFGDNRADNSSSSPGLVNPISRMVLHGISLPELHARFKKATKMRDTTPASEVKLYEQGYSRIDIHSKNYYRSRSMARLLKDLWSQVVEPILDHLLHGQVSQQNSKGESRAWHIPVGI